MLVTWFTQMSFGRTAADLTDEHLHQQIETYSILMDHLTGDKPLPAKEAVQYMWDGYLPAALIAGMMTSLEMYANRRYDEKTFWKFSNYATKMREAGKFRYEAPPWFRDKDVIRSHRSVLMARFPEAYDTSVWPGTPKQMPLLWPVQNSPDDAVASLRVLKADLPRIKSGELVLTTEIIERVVNL